MKRLLVMAALSLALGGFAGGLWTGLSLKAPVEVCTQDLPPAKVESDLTFPVPDDVPKPRLRGAITDFL